MNKKHLNRAAPLLGCVAALTMPAAHADTVCPTPPSGIGGASTLCLSYEETSVGTTSSGLSNPLSVPGTYAYSNTLAGGANGGTPITGSPNQYGFYDDYEFSIVGGAADSLTATINLGGVYTISNLGARIYSVAGLTTLPQLGAVAGEIDGTASGTGALGGTYSGVLQMSAVPLPAAWTFLLSGVAGLSLLARKRR